MVGSSPAGPEPLPGEVAVGLTAGSGPTLVCLHGMLLDHRMFLPQLTGLSARMRVLAYNQRSCDARGAMRYDLATLVEDCAVVVRRLVGGPVVLAGMSMGGLIALGTALDHPDLVRGVVLIASSALPEPPADRERLRSAFAANRDRESLPWDFAEAEARAHFAELTRRTRPELIAETARTIASRSGAAAWLELLSWLDEDVASRLGKIAAPVLVVHGDEDELVPLSRALATREQLQGSRLLVVPFAAHALSLEAPEVVNHAVAQFVQECCA